MTIGGFVRLLLSGYLAATELEFHPHEEWLDQYLQSVPPICGPVWEMYKLSAGMLILSYELQRRDR